MAPGELSGHDTPVRFSGQPRLTCMRKFISLLFLLPFVATPVLADSRALLNVDKSGLAIQGYDPVAFFSQNKPVKGKPEFKASYQGATYLFESAENQMLFEKDPNKYEPAFGGFCAYGVSRNKLAPIDPEAFQILDGHLLLQYSKGVRNDFNKDATGNLAKAKANWPELVEKKGK